ncbi:hypothetical protein YC2023_024496 [Brassica napus]
MDGMTDDLVDIIKEQFAIDLYKDWVVPLSVGDETNCPSGQREALEQNVLATDFGNSNSWRSVQVG